MIFDVKQLSYAFVKNVDKKILDKNTRLKYQLFLISLQLYSDGVDNVDKLLTEEVFPDLYNISGSHSYQQITC